MAVKKAGVWEWGFRGELLRNTVWPYLKLLLPPLGSIVAVVLKMWEHARLADVFLYGLWGLGGGLVVTIAITHWLKQRPEVKEQSSTREGVAVEAPTPNVEIEAFYQTYDNVLLRETEDNIRAQLVPFPAQQDRERFLIRSYATFITIGLFEYLWLLIFASQLRALHHVNGGPINVEELRPFYDTAVQHNAQLASYPFTAWLAFMRSWLLILENGTIIQITVRGREFLKYVVETGRSVDQLVN